MLARGSQQVTGVKDYAPLEGPGRTCEHEVAVGTLDMSPLGLGERGGEIKSTDLHQEAQITRKDM